MYYLHFTWCSFSQNEYCFCLSFILCFVCLDFSEDNFGVIVQGRDITFLPDNMKQKLKWHHIWFYVDRRIPHRVFKMFCFLLCYEFENRSHTVVIVKQEYKEILKGNLMVLEYF